MSGYLAFDRERVQMLALALRGTGDELAHCRCDDPLADSARAAVGATRDAIDSWAPRLSGLTSCVALEAYRPVALDGSSLALVVPRLLYEERGWSVTTDPFDAPAATGSDLLLEARGLGELLRTTDLDDVLDGDERGWLDGELARVAASPPASRAFARALGDDGLAHLCDAYGRERFDADQDDDGEARAAADAAIHSLASIITAANDDPTRVPDVLFEVQPYTSALVVGQLHLDAATLGALCLALLTRWHHELGPGGEPWFDDPHVALDGATGDLLFIRLLEVPGAATQFAVQACAVDPWLLLGSTYDLERMHALVLAATDPAQASTEQAGQIIEPLLGFLRDREPPLGGGPVENLNDRGWLGELVTPWIWQFSYRSSEWGLDLRAANGLLRFVLDDPAAMASVLAQRDDWLSALAQREVDLSSWGAAMDSLRRLQFVIGQVTAAADDEHVSDAFSAQAAWGTTWMLADTALSIATSGLSPVAGYAMGAGASRVEQVAAGATALPDPQATGQEAQRRLDAQLVAGTNAVLGSLDRALRAAGVLAPGYPPIPTSTPTMGDGCDAGELRLAIDDWLARPDLPPAARAHVQEAADVVLGHWAAGYSSGQGC